MIRVDLHVHSTSSDGTCAPAELARVAHMAGVAVLALTDHDTVDGIPEFTRACGKYRVRAIVGIELSSIAPVTTHILGYRLKRLDLIKKAMDWILEKRNARNELICEKIREIGMDITMRDVVEEAGGRVVGRPHFAGCMLKKGYVSSHREAFDRYLARGGLAYVPREAYTPEECIALIREAGGFAALAHPSQTGLDYDALDDMLEEFAGFGLWGLECIFTGCSGEDSYNYMKLADKHSLYATAGSDFHGARRPGVNLGVPVAEDFLPWARLGVTM